MRFLTGNEKDDGSTSSLIPAHLVDREIKGSNAIYSKLWFGEILSQSVTGPEYCIWQHYFFIEQPVLLHPFVQEPVYTLNYMLDGNIPCELKGFGQLELKEATYNLYFVPPVMQDAWFERGFYNCIHVNLSIAFIKELANEYEPLNQLVSQSTTNQTEGIQLPYYKIDHTIRLLLKDILQCSESGVSRTFFFQARVRDLLLQFMRDLGGDSNLVFSIDSRLLEEIYAYIVSHIKESITIKELAKRFGINQVTLSKRFKLSFDVTIHNLLVNLRMKKAEQLLKEGVPIKKIAEQVGYSETAGFSKAFAARFKQSPSHYKRNLFDTSGEQE